ncbi:PPE family protein [Mycobacterium intermedium]|nr:PPE family protein [Mycobacterium intermedium]MCV6964668.1 PPE family protein [Mycobacterium intermedium]
MAAPPEVHSTLLNSGPGPGSLLAAAAQWAALSDEYAVTAAELSGLLSEVLGGTWAGPSSAQYAAAHTPFLAWLTEASGRSAEAATQHETAAAAYSAALAAMPTPAELAANRALLGTLVATNFFGINTIPITVTEADYSRMWVQAATVMGVYQTVSTGALSAVQPVSPAPTIVTPSPAAAAKPRPNTITVLGVSFYDPIADLFSWSEHFSMNWAALKGLLLNPAGTVVQLITDFAASPATAAVTWMPLFYVFAYAFAFALMGTPMYTAVMAPQGAIPLVLSLALCAIAMAPAELVAAVPALPADQQVVTVASIAPSGTTAGGALATPSPAPQAPVTTSTIASAPAAGAPGLAYLVAGPDLGPGPVLGPQVRSKATVSAPAASIPTAAAADARGKSKARRRRRDGLKERGHRNEYMTLDDTPDVPAEELVDVTASTAGAGPLGFTGTATKSTASGAIGLITLAGDTLGSGLSVPMTPATWKLLDADDRTSADEGRR